MGNATSDTSARCPVLSPLMQAVSRRDMPAVSALLPASLGSAAREKLEMHDKQGRTVLAFACGNAPSLAQDCVSRVNLVGYLIARGGSVSVQDAYGWTPLHHACAAGDLDVVRLLLENGADPRVRNYLGISALDFLERNYLVPGQIPIPEYVERELCLDMRHADASNHKTNANTTGYDLCVPEIVHRGEVLNVLLRSNLMHSRQVDLHMEDPQQLSKAAPPSYYVQLYYVDPQRPWVMRKRVGSYRYLTSATLLDNTGEKKPNGNYMVLRFCTAQLFGKFRVLLHTGQGGKFEVNCASNVVMILDSTESNASARKATKISGIGNILDDPRGSKQRVSSGIEITAAVPVDGDEFDVALDSKEADKEESLFGVSRKEARSKAFYKSIASLASTADIWVDGLKQPPPENFTFDLQMYRVDIELALESYPQLLGLRFRLVPCWMEEVSFWRIYFYHVAILQNGSD